MPPLSCDGTSVALHRSSEDGGIDQGKHFQPQMNADDPAFPLDRLASILAGAPPRPEAFWVAAAECLNIPAGANRQAGASGLMVIRGSRAVVGEAFRGSLTCDRFIAVGPGHQKSGNAGQDRFEDRGGYLS